MRKMHGQTTLIIQESGFWIQNTDYYVLTFSKYHIQTQFLRCWFSQTAFMSIFTIIPSSMAQWISHHNAYYNVKCEFLSSTMMQEGGCSGTIPGGKSTI
jgi:hypothetical protein